MTMITRSRARELENQLTTNTPITTNNPLLTQIRQALTCPCCHHVVLNPTTLTCGHTFCSTCVIPSPYPVCPIGDCKKPHYDREPKLDVVLGKVSRYFYSQSPCDLSCRPCQQRSPVSLTSGSDLQGSLQQELECQLCYMVYYEPVTASCGHTLCKQCILTSLDYSDKCSICRAKLPSYQHFYNHAPNTMILTITSQLFPQLLLQRQESIANEIANLVDEIPLFVCSIVFPKMPCLLHIYEARYRVMIRRCLESSRQRFGMVLHTNNSVGFHQYGTMAETRSTKMLHDGRYMVDAVGSFRFRIIERGVRDGYNIARVERIDDADEEMMMEEASSPNGSQGSGSNSDSSGTLCGSPSLDCNSPSLSKPTVAQLQSECVSFMESLRSSSAPWLFQRLNATVGPMPTDPSDFSFWMASIIPLDEQEKYSLLPVTSIRDRLTIILGWIHRLKDQWWFDRMCTVM